MRFSFAWVLSVSTALAAGPPTLRLPEGVRPVKYAAELTLLPDSPGFKAKIDIDVTFAAPTTLFYLNSKEIEIAAAEVNKTKLAVEQVNDDFIALRASSKIPAGAAKLLVYGGTEPSQWADSALVADAPIDCGPTEALHHRRCC